MCYSINEEFLKTANKKELYEYLLNNNEMENKIDFKKFLDENPDYINHYVGNCACSLCICGTCRC